MTVCIRGGLTGAAFVSADSSPPPEDPVELVRVWMTTPPIQNALPPDVRAALEGLLSSPDKPEHEAHVATQPGPGTAHASFAWCPCGWRGEAQSEREAAQEQADSHAWNEPPDKPEGQREEIEEAILNAQADLQAVIGRLRLRELLDIRECAPLERSLARLHAVLAALGRPMAKPATHPDVKPLSGGGSR